MKPFFCLACLCPSFASKESIGRESFHCRWCNSTSRERAILLQIHLHYISRKLRRPFRSLKILGVSDGYLTSKILSAIYRSQYRNYHFHLEPILDITDIPVHLYGVADIISCSEVLEHVEPPIEKAFDGLFQLLKRNGILVLSVPHTNLLGVHIEHFPVMSKSQILISEKGPVLMGVDTNGKQLKFSKLVFHGGVGATLEYRVFSEKSLIQYLIFAQFKKIKSHSNSKFLGITWESWSRVWTAKKC
jgi:hypothetical protein